MDKSAIKRAILDVVRGVIIALVLSMILVLLVSVIAKYTDMSDQVATALNQIIKVIALFGGILLGFRSGKWGLVLGLVAGLLFTLLSFGIFSLISGKLDFNQITVFDFLLGLLAGGASGILVVNLKALKSSRPPRQRRIRKAKA